MNFPKHIKYCCVPQCNNIKNDSLSFHLFPSNIKLCKRWVQNLKMKTWTKCMKICSDHFLPSDFFPTSEYRPLKRLKNTAVPTQKLPVTLLTVKKRNVEQAQKREKRARRRSELNENKNKQADHGNVEEDSKNHILKCEVEEDFKNHIPKCEVEEDSKNHIPKCEVPTEDNNNHSDETTTYIFFIY